MNSDSLREGTLAGWPVRALQGSAVPVTARERARLTIVSLNYHEATKDPRVFKQAQALVARGHRVVIFCRWLKGFAKTETVEGVEIVRFDCFSYAHADVRDPQSFSFLESSRALVEARYAPYAREAATLTAMTHLRDWAEARLAAAQVADAPPAGPSQTALLVEGMGDLLYTAESLGKTASIMSARIGELRAVYKALGERVEAGGVPETELRKLRRERNAARDRVNEWAGVREAVKRRRAEVTEHLTRLEANGPEFHAEMEHRARGSRMPEGRKWILGEIKTQARIVRERFGELYQAQSIIFAVNLMREEMAYVPDILHAHDFYTLPAALRLAETSGARVLYDAHEFEPGRATKMPPEGRSLVDAMERDCLRHVDRMTTVSPSIAKLYEERFSGDGPDLILNAPVIDLAQFNKMDRPGLSGWLKALGRPTRPGRLRAMAGLDRDAPVIVFTGGTQRENRGMDKVCQALAQLPGHHLVAMGPRLASDDAWLIEHAAQAGVAERVHLLEPVSPGEIVETICDADIAICPIQDAGISYRFALPNKLFEAAFARLPVVVSDLPEMRRFVEELGIGTVTDQTNPARIAATIREVMAEPGRYVLTTEMAARLVANFSWQAQEERLAGIVREMGPRAR